MGEGTVFTSTNHKETGVVRCTFCGWLNFYHLMIQGIVGDYFCRDVKKCDERK